MDIIYKASKTLRKFHKDNNFVRTVIGPIGSGKSVGCIADLLMRAHAQKPNAEGIRQTRWVIIRNTYRELFDTTLVTFHEWIPADSGEFSMKNMKFTLEYKMEDDTTLHAEFLFRALDRPNDVKKLLSLEVTGGFINECREIPRAVVDMLQGRCGRYPKTILDPETDEVISEPTWFGIIMDTNPPDSDSWYYKLFEVNLPKNHSIYHQPSGLSEEAENIKYLPKSYYTNMMQGKDKEWIDVYVHGVYGFTSDGKPVFPEYKDHAHSTHEHYEPDPKRTLYIGIDFGLTPAAIFGQITASGQFVLFDELCTFDMGAVSFGKLLKEKLNSKYINFKDIEVYADPAGEQRAQTDEVTPFLILQNQGINAVPAYTNDFTIRREVIAEYMMRLDFNGMPALQVTPGAPTLRKGFAGGYKYKKMQVSGQERYQEKPDKGKYSHACDACQYLFLGAVGGGRVIGGFDNTKPIDYSKQNASYR
jgi:hypothetical protein